MVVGVFYLFNALNHFTKIEFLSGYVASKGVPMGELIVVLTGLLLLTGGVSILLGYRVTIGIATLLIFLIPTTFIMHNFWSVENAQLQTMEMINFMKNLALIGSSLMFLAIPEPWPYSFRRGGS
jgi:uncharacterized membrane protein YphA (DoxX/SURF4 family)